MSRELRLRKPAQADIADAAHWYEARGKGLGAEFLRAVEACLSNIRRSPESHPHVRRAVLGGYLRYREALHAEGLVRGFQWLDGSFLEHVEMTERRAPNDIDVVTFFRLPPNTSQAQLAAKGGLLFDHASVKATYRVDAYLVHLGMAPERLTRESAYWYSVWSHRRNQQWKGFVQVDLAPTEDSTAAATLATPPSPGVRP